jgi:hypothetical protein
MMVSPQPVGNRTRDSGQPPSSLRVQDHWLLYVGLFCLAIVPRVLYLLVSTTSFSGYYWGISDNLLQHGSVGLDGLQTTQYEPLYPVFLTLARAITGDHLALVRVLQAAVDSVGAVLLYGLAGSLTGRSRIALWSAILYALYPLLIRHAIVIGESPLLSVWLIGFAHTIITATTPKRAALAGLLMGAAILTRMMVLPVLALTAASLLLTRQTRLAFVFLLTATTVTAPWLLRNYQLNGALWPTRSGVNLLIGNSPYMAALLPNYDPDVLMLTDYIDRTIGDDAARQLDENALDRTLAVYAWKQMAARPLATVRLMVQKGAYFFWPRLVPMHVITSGTQAMLEPDGRVRVEQSPTRTPLDSASYTVSYGLVALAALVGLWTRRGEWRRDGVLWCIVLTFVATYAVYFPATRYRAAMSFVLLFYAAVGGDRLVAWRVNRTGIVGEQLM